MIYMLMGFAHAALERRLRTIRALVRGEAGQGTVEYVALVLLVALVMFGVVTAMKSYKSDGGQELGDLILDKIKEAVGKVRY